MSIESKKDLPKRYQELADEAGFKAILDSLDASPADMTAVAEVEKQVEDLRGELIKPGFYDSASGLGTRDTLRTELLPTIKKHDLDWELRRDMDKLGRFTPSHWETYVKRPEASLTANWACFLAIVAVVLGTLALIF